MTQPTTFAAHIITSSADGSLGDPEIIVIDHEYERDHTGSAKVVERIPFAGSDADLGDAWDALDGRGWRRLGVTAEVGHGYFMVDVERA